MSKSTSHRTESPSVAPASTGASGPVFRKASSRGNQAKIGNIQRKGSGPVATDAGAEFGKATSGAGSEVPHRAEMEQAFGQDFSGVSAHMGQGDAMANIGADAAAHGESVAFASSSPDKQTVAHELTHVVQSRSGGGGEGGPHLSTGVSNPGSSAEREAESVASRVASGGSAGNVGASMDGSVHRVLPAAGAAIVAGLKGLGAALTTEAAAAAATVAGTMLTAVSMASGAAPGSNGASAHTFEEGAITDRDKLKVQRILTFETVNRYVAQEWGSLIAQARAATDANDAAAAAGPQCTVPPYADPQPCPPGQEPDVPVAEPTPMPQAEPSPAEGIGVTIPDSINGAVITSLQNVIKTEIETAFTNNKQSQSGTANFIWSDSGSHDRDFWGTVGEIIFLQHENTFITKTLAVSEDVRFLGINLQGAGEVSAVKYLGGKMEPGDISIGETLWIDNDSLKIWVASVSQRSYNNDHVQLNVQTNWQWDDNTTNGWFNVNTSTTGPSVVLDRWGSAAPDD